jgi:predicted DNA-binding transcriptional regulator YafY
MEIPKYGADVEVLHPAGLRQRVGDALRAAAQRYR